MIYTITFNPSLDYVMNTDNLTLGHTNRSNCELITVGGKGVNVSLVLAQFGIESAALGFIGGFTGDQLERMLGNSLVKTDFVRVLGGNTRINVKLIEQQMTEINAGGPFVTEDEVKQLLEKTDALKDGDTIVIAGSAPKNVSDDIYERILERLSDRKIKAVVDATGKLLLKTLKYKPFLIKPNIDELGEMFGTKISCESDILKYASELRAMGAQNVLISMGKDGAILFDENKAVRKRAAVGTKAVNPVGAGDSMVAGFLAGLSVDYDNALAHGIAAGGATACSEGLATKELIDQFLNMMNESK